MRWHGFRYSEWRDDWRPTALCFALLAIHRIPIKRVTHCTVVTQLTRHPPFCYIFFETAKYTGARSGNSLMLRMYVYDGGKGWKKSKIQSKILDSNPIQNFHPDPVKIPLSRKDFKSKSNTQSNPNVPLSFVQYSFNLTTKVDLSPKSFPCNMFPIYHTGHMLTSSEDLCFVQFLSQFSWYFTMKH